MTTPDLDELVSVGRGAFAAATDLDALRAAEQAHTGRRSALTDVQRGLGRLDAEQRREVGQQVNAARDALRAALGARRAELESARDAALLESECIDVTLPGRPPARGSVHPISRTTDEIVDVFVGLGYRVAEGPEVETDWHNFQALNIPPAHPARSMQDTLYVRTPDGDRGPPGPDGAVPSGQPGHLVLRTHTSPVQVRTMLAGPPPVHVVAPGRVYRSDTPDATHLPVFHQVELLAVAEGLTMGDLKGTLEAFVRAYLGDDRRIRLRPSYFPFTEPSAEVDVSCFVCDGRGTDCRTCRGEGWIEVLGCGMVHPDVLAGVGYDPDQVDGFAAGIGVERMYMLRSGLADLRALPDNDLRWLARA